MDTTILSKVTVASEKMLDLAKSKNDSDSEPESGNQFKNFSAPDDEFKRVNSMTGVKLEALKITQAPKLNSVKKPVDDPDFFKFDDSIHDQ